MSVGVKGTALRSKTQPIETEAKRTALWGCGVVSGGRSKTQPIETEAKRTALCGCGVVSGGRSKTQPIETEAKRTARRQFNG